MYIEIGISVPGVPLKSNDLVDENNKILTEWKWFETTVLGIFFILILFSSPWPKVQVNYCHHLASVVCKLFTFQVWSPKPLGQLEPNLPGMFLGWSSTKFLFFVPVGYSTWLPVPIICSDWLKFQRSSSLKLMNWLNPNCKGMIIGMSFTKFMFSMPIRNPRWPPPQEID